MASEKAIAESEKARQAQAMGGSRSRPSQSAEKGMGAPPKETNRNNAKVPAASPGLAREVQGKNKPGQAQQPMAQKPNTADKHLPTMGINPNRPPAVAKASAPSQAKPAPAEGPDDVLQRPGKEREFRE